MRTSKPFLLAAAVMMAVSFIFISGSVLALNPKYDEKILPGDFDKFSIPYQETSVDIKVTSDIPVDVFVMSDQQYTDFESGGIANDYEKSYTYVTSKTFNYNGDSDVVIHWIVIVNDDSSRTANVTVEFEVIDDISDACCGSTVLIGFVSLVAIVAILYVIRRR